MYRVYANNSNNVPCSSRRDQVLWTVHSVDLHTPDRLQLLFGRVSFIFLTLTTAHSFCYSTIHLLNTLRIILLTADYLCQSMRRQ